MERGLRELALATPVIALAGEQALAEHHLEAQVITALRVALGVVDEHVLHHVGVVDQVVLERAELEAHDVAVAIA